MSSNIDDVSFPRPETSRGENPFTPPPTTQRTQHTVIEEIQLPLFRGPRRGPNDHNWTPGPDFSIWKNSIENYCAVAGIIDDIDKINIAKFHIDPFVGLAYPASNMDVHIADKDNFSSWMAALRLLCDSNKRRYESAWVRGVADALTHRREQDESFAQFYVRIAGLQKFLFESALDSKYNHEDADKLSCAVHEFILFYEMPQKFSKYSCQIEGEPMRLNTQSVFNSIWENVGDLPYRLSLREETERKFKATHHDLKQLADEDDLSSSMKKLGLQCDRQITNYKSAWVRGVAYALTYRREPDESFVQFYVRILHLPKLLFECALNSKYNHEDADRLSCAVHEFILFYEMPQKFSKYSCQIEGEPMRLNTKSVFDSIMKKVGELPYNLSLREENEKKFEITKPRLKAVDAIRCKPSSAKQERKYHDNQTQKSECFYCKKKGHAMKDCYHYLDDEGKKCKRCRQKGHGKVECKNPSAI